MFFFGWGDFPHPIFSGQIKSKYFTNSKKMSLKIFGGNFPSKKATLLGGPKSVVCFRSLPATPPESSVVLLSSQRRRRRKLRRSRLSERYEADGFDTQCMTHGPWGNKVTWLTFTSNHPRNQTFCTENNITIFERRYMFQTVHCWYLW